MNSLNSKWLIAALVGFAVHSESWGLPNGAPVCEVQSDYANITGMLGRTRNASPGDYQLSADMVAYQPGVPLVLTLSGSQFIGVMMGVVDETGQGIGVFGTAPGIRLCDVPTMAITHSSLLGKPTSITLTWMPPQNYSGTLYVQAYVLAGSAGILASQEFFRLVRGDNSALALPEFDTLFKDDFENL